MVDLHFVRSFTTSAFVHPQLLSSKRKLIVTLKKQLIYLPTESKEVFSFINWTSCEPSLGCVPQAALTYLNLSESSSFQDCMCQGLHSSKLKFDFISYKAAWYYYCYSLIQFCSNSQRTKSGGWDCIIGIAKAQEYVFCALSTNS